MDQECFSSPFSSLSFPSSTTIRLFLFLVDHSRWNNPLHSSLTIFARSFPPDEIYQLMIEIIDRSNASEHFLVYLLVDLRRSLSSITIRSALLFLLFASFVRCSSLLKNKSPRDDRFYLLNRHDQLNLFSSLKNVSGIEWKIFEGLSNGSWSLLEGPSPYLFGQNEKNLTIGRGFFESFPSVQSWRFRVISSSSETGDFFVEMNDPPRNGSCSISPLTGDLFTEFSIICRDWFDENPIKDYLLLVSHSTTRLLLSSSLNGSFLTVLPFTLNRSEEFVLSVIIRDELHSSTEFFGIPPMKIVTEIERFFELPPWWPVQTFIPSIEQIEEEFLYQISQSQSLSHWSVAPLDDRSPRTLVRHGFLRRKERHFFFFFEMLNLSLFDRERFVRFREDLLERIFNATVEDLRFHSSILSHFTRQLSTRTAVSQPRESMHLLRQSMSLADRLGTMFVTLLGIGIDPEEFLLRRSSFDQPRSSSMFHSDADGSSSHFSLCFSISLSSKAINGPLQQRSSIVVTKISVGRRRERECLSLFGCLGEGDLWEESDASLSVDVDLQSLSQCQSEC